MGGAALLGWNPKQIISHRGNEAFSALWPSINSYRQQGGIAAAMQTPYNAKPGGQTFPIIMQKCEKPL